MDSKYINSKIYKIINSVGSKCYIGSTTTELRKRFYNHKSKFNRGTGMCTSKEIFRDDPTGCKIILVEKFPCQDKTELNKRERYWIENTDCVNKTIPTRTRKEYYEDNKELIKQYCHTNRQHRLDYQKKYYQQNKSVVNEKHRAHHLKNKDDINAKKRQQYWEKRNS